MSLLDLAPNLEREHALWKTHMAVGRIAYDDGLYGASIRNYLQALHAAEIINLADEYVSQVLFGLARCYVELEQYSEAEKLYKRVIAMDQVAADTSFLAVDLNDLAVVYLRRGKIEMAVDLLHQALALLESTGDENAVEVATTLKNLAQISCMRNLFSESNEYIDRAFALSNTAALRRTKLFAEILVVKALISAQQGCLSEAEDLLQQGIAILEVATGGDHPELACFLNLAADILRKQGLDVQAQPLIDRAKAIRLHLKGIDC